MAAAQGEPIPPPPVPAPKAQEAPAPAADDYLATCIGDTEGLDYKSIRLREMSCMWQGTILEPHTVKLLSMLIQEDGTVTAERRHDCEGSRGCFAVGIQGHHICHRGTPIVAQDHGKPFKKFCYSGALGDFEKEYPGFASDWRIQFAEYTRRMTDCIGAGSTANQCVQNWNSREAGRIAKVDSHSSHVVRALGW